MNGLFRVHKFSIGTLNVPSAELNTDSNKVSVSFHKVTLVFKILQETEYNTKQVRRFISNFYDFYESNARDPF